MSEIIKQMEKSVEQMRGLGIEVSNINFIEQVEVLERFEKNMAKKGINEEQIKDMMKNGKAMILPSKMVLVFEEKYGYNPNILWS
jgi:hypothetical protein